MASLTVKTWLNNAASQLQSQGYDTNEAELVLGFVLDLAKADILAHPEQELTLEQTAQAETLLQRRLANEPIAYITGQKDFYGRTFIVTPDVLIPRPDSEIIIDEVKKILTGKPTASILDVGTGSGCLIISIALETENKYTYTAVDISTKALNIARENAKALGAHVNFLQSNLLESLNNKNQNSDSPCSLQTTHYSLVIANLPYLTGEQMTEPSIQHEPKLALEGGKEGLHYYRQLLPQLPQFLAADGIALLEIDPDQVSLLSAEIKNILPNYQINFIQDLSGRTRVVKISQ